MTVGPEEWPARPSSSGHAPATYSQHDVPCDLFAAFDPDRGKRLLDGPPCDVVSAVVRPGPRGDRLDSRWDDAG